MGLVADAVSRGPGRAADLAERVVSLASAGQEDPDLPAGAGPIWVGGMAFDPGGAGSPEWSSFAPARLWLPRLSIVRAESGTWLTAGALEGEDPAAVVAEVEARCSRLGRARLPLHDPMPGGATVASVRDPASYEEAVAEATRRIARGDLEKIVLAREVLVTAPRAHDPAGVFGVLRDAFPDCFAFCVGTPEAAFLGASPELLVRRRGAGASTVALAGSTRRSADPATDDHLAERLLHSPKDLAEHRIVARRIVRALRPESVWIAAEDEPSIVRVSNIQHLATPIRAQLARSRSALELAALLHPTPAVGGEPAGVAHRLIAELEGMDRGWYAAPVGWMDSTADGEFCVALRSALLRDRTARLYAGAGIVEGSDPQLELAETELKLGALLPLLAG